MMVLFACVAPSPATMKETGSTDTATETTDSGDTDTGDTDSGDTDTGDTDTGDTDTDDTDSGDTGTDTPELAQADATTLPVATADGLPPISGFSVNGRIHPHGLPTTWEVEYGATDAYGERTPARALPGRLDAWYREGWDEAVNGFSAGIGRGQLSHVAEGGPDGTGFVRYTDDQGAGDDTNHLDGIGAIHLGLYAYIGHYDPGDAPPLYLGGGFPDLRGARLSMYLRGQDWQANGTELGSWIQGYRDISVVELVPEDSRFPNWAFTGQPLTALAETGAWELAEWTLSNRTTDWTFAGANGGRLLYDYGELDAQLSHVNVDFFPIQILWVDQALEPRGALDYDTLTLNYRQHSVTAPGNGGTLVSSPGGTGAELLTDGWRNGVGHEWQSDADPPGPLSFEYSFADPIQLYSVTVHNATEHPSQTFEVSVSPDAGVSWYRVGSGKLPIADAAGPNACFVHLDAWELVDGVNHWTPLYPGEVNRLRVTVNSGYEEGAWGLGEIEAFGTGAVEATDDDWYDVNQDVLVPSGVWHYRLVATSAAGSTVGPDQVVEVP